MLGLDETIKKLWITIDSPRTDAKERIKAITLLKECYKERLELIRSEPSLIKQKGSFSKYKTLRDLNLAGRWVQHTPLEHFVVFEL